MKAKLIGSVIASNPQEAVDFIEKIQKQQIAVAIILWHLN